MKLFKSIFILLAFVFTSVSYADRSLEEFAVNYYSIEPVLHNQKHDAAFKKSLNLALIENSQTHGYSDLLEKYIITGNQTYVDWGHVATQGYVIVMRLETFASSLGRSVATIDLKMRYRPYKNVLTIERIQVTRLD